ncbi:hypothetical protein K474DRAFT_1680836 [Panus rudis PR-1116 ss-1]|nr:hypothetical protein K474DRAFT_1680836 [Panus rudis PR-1116 ss-1]
MARIELLDLNDDVLRIIFTHIPNIMNVALTCRRIHDLAIECIIAVVWIRTTERLRRLCNYALSPPRYRAVYIEELSVWTKTHEDREANDRAQDADALLGKLLVKAQNLRSIEINRFAGVMKKSSLARKALGTMSYLTEATLLDINEASLSVLPSMKHLRTMTLYFEGSPKVEALVTALAACPSLLKLTLKAKPSLGLPPKCSHVPSSSITSLQDLTLYWCSSRTLELVHVCPNLSSLTIEGMDRAKGAELKVIEQFPPKLRRIYIPQLPYFYLVERSCAPGALQFLHLGDHWSHESIIYLGNEEDHSVRVTRQVLALIRGTSPVGLRICLHAPLQPDSFWATLAATAPRLRFLDITISLRSESPDIPDASWTELLLDSLRNLPLVCLKLYLPNIQTDMRHLTYDIWADRALSSNPDVARKLYQQRQEEITAKVVVHRNAVAHAMLAHMEDLPERLANDLPNLKYLAFGSEAQAIMMQNPRTASGIMAPSCVYNWYKAVAEGEKKRMVAIPPKEGEKVWETLKDGDLSVVENIQ